MPIFIKCTRCGEMHQPFKTDNIRQCGQYVFMPNLGWHIPNTPVSSSSMRATMVCGICYTFHNALETCAITPNNTVATKPTSNSSETSLVKIADIDDDSEYSRDWAGAFGFRYRGHSYDDDDIYRDIKPEKATKDLLKLISTRIDEAKCAAGKTS